LNLSTSPSPARGGEIGAAREGSGNVSERTYRLSGLIEALERCLRYYGVSPEHAARIAEVLVDCELRGYDDHGVSFLGSIAEWYRTGALNPKPAVRVLREDRAGILLDGDSGCGAIAVRACRKGTG